MNPRSALALALAAALVLAACTGGDDDADPGADEEGTELAFAVEAPSTPAGDALVWLMDAFGTRPDDRAMAERFHPTFIEQVGVEELRDGLEAFTDPARTLRSVRIDEPDEVLAVVVIGDAPWQVSLVVEPDAPHRMLSLSIAPVEPLPQNSTA